MEGIGEVLGLGGGVTALQVGELSQSGEWARAVLAMEKKNWKSPEHCRGILQVRSCYHFHIVGQLGSCYCLTCLGTAMQKTSTS